MPDDVPHADPAAIADPFVAALVRAIQARMPAAAAPDPAIAELLRAQLPAELTALLRAFAWHAVPVTVGDAELCRPFVAKGKARGSAKLALQIGALGSGDPIVARVKATSIDVVELLQYGAPERRHGSLGTYLRHCVSYARDREVPTPLDAFLPAGVT